MRRNEARVERRGKEKKSVRRNTFSQQTSNSRQAAREVAGSTMEPLTSKTVIHAGRASLLPGCKAPIVFLTARTRYNSRTSLSYALFPSARCLRDRAERFDNLLMSHLCHYLSPAISSYRIRVSRISVVCNQFRTVLFAGGLSRWFRCSITRNYWIFCTIDLLRPIKNSNC